MCLTPAQVEDYGLPPALGKAGDSRAAGFLERHGELVQVELEALDPNDLHALLDQHIAPLLDRDLIAEQRQRQHAEAAELRALADRFSPAADRGAGARGTVSPLRSRRARRSTGSEHGQRAPRARRSTVRV